MSRLTAKMAFSQKLKRSADFWQRTLKFSHARIVYHEMELQVKRIFCCAYSKTCSSTCRMVSEPNPRRAKNPYKRRFAVGTGSR